MAGDGSFVVAWTDQLVSDTDGNTYVRRFSAAGTPLGAGFPANIYTSDHQFYPHAARADDGRFVIVWASEFQDSSEWGVYGQRYSSAGTPLGLNQ